MTLEQALLSALTAVSGVLLTVARLLWKEALECKDDRKTIRTELDRLNVQVGLSTGRLEAVEHCPQASCPFQRSAKVGVVLLLLSVACLFSGCATAPSGISVGWEGDLAGVPVRASYKGGKATVIVDRRVNPTK
jgi:hypothetical protein